MSCYVFKAEGKKLRHTKLMFCYLHTGIIVWKKVYSNMLALDHHQVKCMFFYVCRINSLVNQTEINVQCCLSTLGPFLSLKGVEIKLDKENCNRLLRA